VIPEKPYGPCHTPRLVQDPDLPRFPLDFSFIMTKAGFNLETAVGRKTTVSRLNISHLPGTLASQDRIKLFTLPLLLPFTKGKKLLRRKKFYGD